MPEEINSNIYRFVPLSEFNNIEFSPENIFYTMALLSPKDQVEFIKRNLNYIKENREKIFTHVQNRKQLSSFFTYKTFNEISRIDKEIALTIINKSFFPLISTFSLQEINDLYTHNFSLFDEIDNLVFMRTLSDAYSRIRDITNPEWKEEFKQLVNETDAQFIQNIINIYSKKIESFNDSIIFNFYDRITHTASVEAFKNVSVKYREKILSSLEHVDPYEMLEWLCEFHFKDIIPKEKANIFYELFARDIIIKFQHKGILDGFYIDVLKENWDVVTLSGMVNSIDYIHYNFSDDDKKLLDEFKLDSIEDVYLNYLPKDKRVRNEPRALKYIEDKFMASIETDGNIEEIDDNTSIYSRTYLKNLKELKILIKAKKINRSDPVYKKHFLLFYKTLLKNNFIEDIQTPEYLNEIERFFVRIINGEPLSSLGRCSCFEEIILHNRLNHYYNWAKTFNYDTLMRFNVKEYLHLCDNHKSCHKPLLLKLMLIVGYQKAEYMLSIDDTRTTLEHLVGTIDVKNVKLDKNGDPILNKKIINLLFNDQSHTRIKDMLLDKDSRLYYYFPRIFNEWDNIKKYPKANSLVSILDLLESQDIVLPAKYCKIKTQFRHIGISDKMIKETQKLYDCMLERHSSTIPKVKGELGEYTYEVLDLHDPYGLAVGNRTNCCFTVWGVSYSSLKHALTNKNGRILVIKKGPQLIAHSWLWRNGNLLCLDNIEVNKQVKEIDFCDVYLQFADEILKKSLKYEGPNDCIKNITIGRSSVDTKAPQLNSYPHLVQTSNNIGNREYAYTLMADLPQPIEAGLYSDAKGTQCIIKNNAPLRFYQSDYLYPYERDEVLCYDSSNEIEQGTLNAIINKVNTLRYIKSEEENTIDTFKIINIYNFSQIYCNDEWYILIDKNGNIEKYIHSDDQRAQKELENIYKSRIKKR